MKKYRIITVVLALVCAFGMLGLVACGGGSSASSGGSQQQAAQPEPTDEELIKADAEKVVGTLVTADYLLEGLQADETLKSFEDMGFDLKAYAENMAKLFKSEIGEIKVSGDTATAELRLTVPEFTSEKANELMEEKLKDVSQDKDITSLRQDEQMKLFAQAMNAVLDDPNFPTSTSSIDIDYVKNNGTWEMKDKVTVEDLLNSTSK